MNKKAELFDAYLKDKKITAFTVDEIKDDPLHTTVFRSHIEVGGARLPTIAILDSSIYAMIRILIAPKALATTGSTSRSSTTRTARGIWCSIRASSSRRASWTAI